VWSIEAMSAGVIIECSNPAKAFQGSVVAKAAMRFKRRMAGIRTSGTLSRPRRPAYPHQTQGELFMTRLIALLLIAGTAALAGCNTMAGAGQDISKGGNAITNSADKHGAE
jgi:predicted small secreted protein